MSHHFVRRFVSTRSLIWFLTILVVSSSLVGCQCFRDLFGHKGKDVVRLSSANLTVDPSIDDLTIKKALSQAVQAMGQTLRPEDIKIRRCPCDSLINLELPLGWSIEGHDGEIAVRTPGGGQSGDIDLPGSGTVLAGFNYPINTFDPSQSPNFPKDSAAGSENNIRLNLANPATVAAAKIAVFDSGLLQGSYVSGDYILPSSQCKNGGLDPRTVSTNGWNFTTEGLPTDVFDNNIVHHGSRVANLIVRQFNGATTVIPKILPMKVLKADNKGDLFGLMCAMKTAQKNDVKIFNMSLGYYGQKDELFYKYIRDAQRAGIWMVVASGNHPVDSVGLERDLTSMKSRFYPAYFASEFDHIVPVTTVTKTGANNIVSCERQNYAKQYVIGALDESSVSCRLRMGDGPGASIVHVFGTSYAAPVVTGWLARQLAQSEPIHSRADIPGKITNQGAGGDQVVENKYIKSNL